jgi:hypothetical protein
VLGLHYTFATNFLVSLFDEKLSRREIDPTNFLQRSSRPPPPGCPLDCSRECIETGQGMIECKRANSQIQHATEFDFVVVYHRTPGLDEHLAITLANTTTFIPIAEPHCHGSITVVGRALRTHQLFQSHLLLMAFFQQCAIFHYLIGYRSERVLIGSESEPQT